MWTDTLREWTQTMYGLIHSVKLSSAVDMGNINRVDQSISESLSWFSGSQQFNSNIEQRNFKSDRVNLNDGDIEQVTAKLKINLLKVLLIDLAALCDALLAEILAKHKNEEEISSVYPYLRNKVEAVACTDEAKWAQKGVLELNILRNCIIHNDTKWNDKGLMELRNICSNITASPGDSVTLTYEDLLRYKRAVRTLLNQADTHGIKKNGEPGRSKSGNSSK
jgi:hypothetical protein